jgi:tetratricopeptide (TPR) repeat protein
MKKVTKSVVLGLALSAAAAAWVGPVSANTALDRMRTQLETAARLIEDSSAAKRIAASNNADAQALQNQAKTLFRQAAEALDKGRTEEAKTLLSDAKKTMFKAVQAAGSGRVKTDKAKHDYEVRALSILALLKAQGRVADEKHAGAAEARLYWEVETMLADAGSLYQNGDYTGGREILNRAYDKLKVSIERMLGGEILEHKVEFETIKDEYDYYMGKTKSQLDALTMAAGSVAGTPKETSVQLFSQKMQDARTRAKTLADKGDFDDALKILVPIFKSAPFQLMSLLR